LKKGTASQLREKDIEQKLSAKVKAMGGMAIKFTSPGMDGMPDRLILLPGGRIAFVEMKAPGEQMRPLQLWRKKQLEALGIIVFCIDRVDQIGGVLDEIQAT
jgi:hypothetical protein